MGHINKVLCVYSIYCNYNKNNWGESSSKMVISALVLIQVLISPLFIYSLSARFLQFPSSCFLSLERNVSLWCIFLLFVWYMLCFQCTWNHFFQEFQKLTHQLYVLQILALFFMPLNRFSTIFNLGINLSSEFLILGCNHFF